jgi:hypothetical protein
MKIGDYKQMMAYLTRPEQPKEQVADLADELTPGPLKDELKKDFDPSQETHEEYLQRKALGERPFNAQDGGRANLAIGGGAIEGEDLGTREGFGSPEAIEYLKSLKPGSAVNTYAIGKQFGIAPATVRGQVERNFPELRLQTKEESVAKATETRRKLYKQKQSDVPVVETKVRGSGKEARTKGRDITGIRFPNEQMKNDYIQDLTNRYSGVKGRKGLTNKELAEKYLSSSNPNDIGRIERINNYFVKNLNLEYEKAPISEVKEKRTRRLAITQGGRSFKGTEDIPFHHIMPIGGEVDLTTKDVAFINKQMNSKLAPYNTKLNDIADGISNQLNNQEPGYLKRIDELNNQAEQIIESVKTRLPKKYQNYIGFNRLDPILDENATPIRLNVTRVGVDDTKSLAGKIGEPVKLEGLTQKNINEIKKLKYRNAIKNFPISTGGPTLGANLGLLKGIGETLPYFGTPLGAAVLTGGFGLDPKNAMDRVGIEAELALAPELVKQSAKFSPAIQKILNFGLSPTRAAKVARVASPIGILSLGGEALYKYGKFVKDELDRIEKMSPEEREAYNIAEQEQMGVAAANGGLIRKGFGGGSDMGTVADSQGNVGPGAGGYQGGGTEGPDDRSTAAQTAAHNAAVAAAQAANTVEEKMNILDTLNTFRPNTFFNPYNYSVGLNKNIGPFGLNVGINTLGMLGIDDPRTPEDESEQPDYGINAGYNTDLFGGNLSLGAGYNPMSGANIGLSFSKQFNQGGRVGFADGPEDPGKRKFVKVMAGLASLPILGRFLKPATKAVEAAAPVAEKAVSEAEKLFFNLVDAVKNKGIMKKLDEMTNYRQGGAYHEYKGAEVLEDGGSITARFKTDKGAPAEVVYIKPQKGIDPKTGKEVEYPGQFEYEAQEVYKMTGDGNDYYKDFEDEIIDSIEDVKKIIDD